MKLVLRFGFIYFEWYNLKVTLADGPTFSIQKNFFERQQFKTHLNQKSIFHFRRRPK